MKILWSIAFLIVFSISFAILFLMGFDKSGFGYMKYDFTQFPQKMKIHDKHENKNVVFKVCLWTSLIASICISIIWNMFLIKAIYRPIPDYQVRTIDDLVRNNYHLVGGALAKNIIQQSHKVYSFNTIKIHLKSCFSTIVFSRNEKWLPLLQ